MKREYRKRLIEEEEYPISGIDREVRIISRPKEKKKKDKIKRERKS
jgi:hypothetical protein